jgi:hypothetical protein
MELNNEMELQQVLEVVHVVDLPPLRLLIIVSSGFIVMKEFSCLSAFSFLIELKKVHV